MTMSSPIQTSGLVNASQALPTTSASKPRLRPFFPRGNSNNSVSTTETALDEKSGHTPSLKRHVFRPDRTVHFSEDVQIIPHNAEALSDLEKKSYFITVRLLFWKWLYLIVIVCFDSCACFISLYFAAR